MHNNLPPMQALKSFEAAARLSSISKAAAELCVTQGAVSKQVKHLEDFIGVQLFNRGAKGIYLTESGHTYFNVVAQTLNLLSCATHSLQDQPKQQQLLIDVIPSICHIWLIPRIHSFEQRFPHLQVDLISGDGEPDFNRTQADLAIRCLKSSTTLKNAQFLLKERLVLVASPDLLRKTPITTATDILKHKLLQQNTRANMWQIFFHLQQLQTSDTPLRLGIGFQHFFMSIKAAEEGLGIALVPDFLARPAIDNKRLINPLQLNMLSEYHYFLHSPSYKALHSKNMQFSRWLIEEFADCNIV